MFKNIFCDVEYIGRSYFGFQLQNKKKKKDTPSGRGEITVQEVFERALARLFKEKIRIDYASRTDRGVHARSQGINFKVETKIPLKNIKRALNSFLPDDVIIKKVKSAPLDFHARFSAKSKVYRYIIFNRKQPSVFLREFSWHIKPSLDMKAIKKVSQEIVGKKDFGIFAKEAKKYKDCTREIKRISIRKKGCLIHIDIEADGFLRNMARNIILFLIKVGEGRINCKDAYRILQGKFPYVKKPAPAYGLYLLRVNYK